MDFLIFTIVVTAIAALSIGFLKAIIFAVILLASIVIAPMVVLVIIGLLISPYTVTRRKLREKKDSKNVAENLVKGIHNGKILGYVSQYLTYGAILLITYQLGMGYFWAALAGMLVKTFYDFMWGDLPFQKPKNPQS